jgi:hypothetical protein
LFSFLYLSFSPFRFSHQMLFPFCRFFSSFSLYMFLIRVYRVHYSRLNLHEWNRARCNPDGGASGDNFLMLKLLACLMMTYICPLSLLTQSFIGPASKVRGFKPDRGRWILRVIKSVARLPSEGK